MSIRSHNRTIKNNFVICELSINYLSLEFFYCLNLIMNFVNLQEEIKRIFTLNLLKGNMFLCIT